MKNNDHDFVLINTLDGSHTVANKLNNLKYHSNFGAIQESKHIFIKNGLNYFLTEHPNLTKIRILEIGFGTGLNSLLTFLETEHSTILIDYTGLETSPLPSSFIKQINHSELLNLNETNKIFYYNWFVNEIDSPDYFQKNNFKLTIKYQSFQTYVSQKKFDVIYYDAFGPNEAPELWEKTALKKASDLLNESGIFVSFCAKGQVKRDLRSNGLFIESPTGPPGKREITRAIKSSITNKIN